MKRNLVIRTITGIVFVLVLVGGVVLGPQIFGLLFALITGLTTWEFCTILNRYADVQINRFITTVAAVYFFFAVFGFNVNIMGAGIFIPFMLTIIYLLVAELYLNHASALKNWAFSFMAMLYIALPFSLLNTLSFITMTDNHASYELPRIVYTWIFTLSIFVFLWANDSGAYCFGSLLGKHRLFPRISPKKSWEGSVGGGIVAILASQIIATYSHDFYADDMLLNRLAWAGLSIVVVVFGTWGDLVESLIKRQLGIKDSGHILPGHGGMLDRFDSSLLAIPAAVVYIYSMTSGDFARLLERLF